MAGYGIRKDLQESLCEAMAAGRGITAKTKAETRRLDKAVRRGDLLSPARGVYVGAKEWQELKPTQQDLLVARTLQQLHPTWVFCGITAALVHGLAVSFALTGAAHVVVSRNAHTRSIGMRGVRRHIVERDDAVTVDGIRVTSIERTVFDCLRSAGFREALAIVDSALYKKKTTVDQLRTAFEGLASGFDGRGRALQILSLADGRAESGGESVARAVMIERGYRLPELQHEVEDILNPNSSYRVDFYWKLREHDVVIGELDGREKYVNPVMTEGRSLVDVLSDERLRESRVSGAGARVMRFSYANVLDRDYFSQLLDAFGIPRDAEIPCVAVREDDPEACISKYERMLLGSWKRLLPAVPKPQVYLGDTLVA